MTDQQLWDAFILAIGIVIGLAVAVILVVAT